MRVLILYTDLHEDIFHSKKKWSRHQPFDA